jgi:hypothetical protein
VGSARVMERKRYYSPNRLDPLLALVISEAIRSLSPNLPRTPLASFITTSLSHLCDLLPIVSFCRMPREALFHSSRHVVPTTRVPSPSPISLQFHCSLFTANAAVESTSFRYQEFYIERQVYVPSGRGWVSAATCQSLVIAPSITKSVRYTYA